MIWRTKMQCKVELKDWFNLLQMIQNWFMGIWTLSTFSSEPLPQLDHCLDSASTKFLMMWQNISWVLVMSDNMTIGWTHSHKVHKVPKDVALCYPKHLSCQIMTIGQTRLPATQPSPPSQILLQDTTKYLTLRSVLSLNNPQNSEMIFCENMKLTCWKSS
jgi:hypothetical protein